jgi:hypothetical protein
MSKVNILILALLTFSSVSTYAESEGMPSMPLIQPKRTFVVSSTDDLQSQQGFGDKEPEVKMQNLMMVEGSGMEGMNMGSHVAVNDSKMAAAPASSAPATYAVTAKTASDPKVGTNVIDISVADPKTNAPVHGLKLKSKVYMTSMDMGTEEPPVKEIKPGQYQVKAGFAMKGPWAVKIILPDNSEKVFNFNAQKEK